MKLGWNFGRTPMGLHQVAAFAKRREACSCDPRWKRFVADIACPLHGLAATLCTIARRARQEEAA